MVHPGVYAWWKHARHHGGPWGEEAHAACEGPGCHGREHHRHGHGHEGHGHDGPEAYAAPFQDGDSAFGVRRPLRFLSFKLELEEEQVGKLAAVLNDLKTERAQAAVDHRRSTSGIADAIAAESLDLAKLKEAAGERVKTAERLRDAVADAIGKIYAILTPEQRAKFAYMIRTGVISV